MSKKNNELVKCGVILTFVSFWSLPLIIGFLIDVFIVPSEPLPLFAFVGIGIMWYALSIHNFLGADK